MSETILAFLDFNILILTTFLLIIFFYWHNVRRPHGVPPGPPAYIPILGNLVDFDESNALKVFEKYRKKYGDMYSLKTGNKLTIVINGQDALKEAFIKHADVFSGRPKVFWTQTINNGMGVASSSDHLWKVHRTFALETLRDFGFGKRSIESNIIAEVEYLLTELELLDSQSKDITKLVETRVSNIICSIVFGQTFNNKDPRFSEILQKMEEYLLIAGFSGALNFLPILRFLPGDPFKGKKAIDMMKEIDHLLLEFIKEHEATFDESIIRDYIDAFIKEKQKRIGKDSETFTDFQLLRVISDLFLAGTETTSTSIRWAILYFMHHPEVQEKLRKEIYDVIGISRLPTVADRPNLPYCEAVLTEVLRCGDIAPLAAPHGVSRDIVLQGYRIPKDAIILPNLHSVLYDPDIYPDPDEFNPLRYIDEDGNFVIKERSLAFSLGRRVCLGENLARMEMFLFIASMVQRFSFQHGAEKTPSYKEFIMGATKTPKPFSVKITKLI